MSLQLRDAKCHDNLKLLLNLYAAYSFLVAGRPEVSWSNSSRKVNELHWKIVEKLLKLQLLVENS